MAAPTLVAVSTGSTDASGAWTHTGAAPGAAGRFLLCQIVIDGVTAGTPTITSTTNIVSLSGTANQWTAAPGNPYPLGSPTAAGQLLFFARSISTTAPVITGANVGGDDIYIRIYEFTDVNTGSTVSAVLENGTAGTLVNNTGTSAAMADTPVTTIGVDRLAVQICGWNDDVTAGAPGSPWTSGAQYNEAGGTDASLKIASAAAASAATFDSASTSTLSGSASWGVVGFALIGTTASGTPHTATPADSITLSDNVSPVLVAGPGPAIRRQRRASRYLTHR